MQQQVQEKNGDGLQTVVLTLQILEHVVRANRGVGVTSLANALDTTKSRIHRHLQTLVQEGYIVQQEDSERYEVGPKLMLLGQTVGSNVDLMRAAYDPLIELRDALGHSAVASYIVPDGMRVMVTVPGRSPIEIGVRVGSTLSFHGSAQGKVAVAFSSPEFQARVLRSKLDLFTPQTVISPAALAADFELIRRQGWAVAPNQTAIGLNTVAAPIFDVSGMVCGAIGIVDMVQFIAEMPSDDQIQRTLKAAQRVSSGLGYDGILTNSAM